MKYFDEDDIIQLKETFDSEVLKKIDYFLFFINTYKIIINKIPNPTSKIILY